MTSRDVLLDVIEGAIDEISKETIHPRETFAEIEKSLLMEEVTVIEGVRRCGKTFILFQLQKANSGIYINFEDERLYGFRIEDFEKLLDIALEKKSKLLLMDEIQHVRGWEKFAHRIHRKMKIVVTGSNSHLLSSDFSTALTGRTKSFKLRPLSFTEFNSFRGLKPSREGLRDYLTVGGFPRIVLTDDSSLSKEYLNRIIYRDILPKENLKHPEALKGIALFLLSNVGKEFSYRSLKTVSGIKHEGTVKEYLGMLKDAFLLEVLHKYSPSIVKQATYGKKVYATDQSFISLGRRVGSDHGRVLENVVYLHLSRDNDLFFLKNGKEVDFLVCQNLKPKRIVNVSYDLQDDNTRKREFSSLKYFQERMKLPAELVSYYPAKIGGNITLRSAHRYLS